MSKLIVFQTLYQLPLMFRNIRATVVFVPTICRFLLDVGGPNLGHFDFESVLFVQL